MQTKKIEERVRKLSQYITNKMFQSILDVIIFNILNFKYIIMILRYEVIVKVMLLQINGVIVIDILG
jgi:hypothetical protein